MHWFIHIKQIRSLLINALKSSLNLIYTAAKQRSPVVFCKQLRAKCLVRTFQFEQLTVPNFDGHQTVCYICSEHSVKKPTRLSTVNCSKWKGPFKWHWLIGCSTLNKKHIRSVCAHTIFQSPLLLENVCQALTIDWQIVSQSGSHVFISGGIFNSSNWSCNDLEKLIKSQILQKYTLLT